MTEWNKILVQSAGMILFSIFHSLAASEWVKQRVRKFWAPALVWYRIFFNLLSGIILVVMWFRLPHPKLIVYEIDFPLSSIFYIIQLSAAFGFLYALRDFNNGEFLGYSQILRFLRERRLPDRDEKYSLNTSGMYAISRHPLYLFSIIFFLFMPQMNTFTILINLWLIFYFYFGSIFEERRLVNIFGNDYTQYKKHVSRIFPLKWMAGKISTVREH